MEETRLSHLLADPAGFSRHILEMPLYQYQQRPLLAVLESVLAREGREFLLVFPRQSGKNELVAHLLVYLLNLLRRSGGQIVYAAIGDGLGRGVRRLEERLDNRLNRGEWQKAGRPTRRLLGRAAVCFISSHPQAFSRGETADWLLVVDELQDQTPGHLEAVLEPMRAAHNATALYIGTVRNTHDALWQKKLQLERLEAADGLRRVFMVPPEQVVAENPLYGAFLRQKEAQLGREHPVVQSEYYLQPLDRDGGLFPPRRRALMMGNHPRQHQPIPGRLYVACLDVGGQDEASTDPFARLDNPARDYTVATIFEVVSPQPSAAGPLSQHPTLDTPHSTLHTLPTFHALDIFVDHGSRHFQEVPGRPALARRLLAWLQQWQVAHLVVDGTGVGEGLADWPAAALGRERVTAFRFNTASKAALGNSFVALVETGRFKYWGEWEHEVTSEYGSDPHSPTPLFPYSLTPLSDAWWFFQQAAACTYDLPPHGDFARHLRWGVPAAARVNPAGEPLPIHDDRLLSAALVVEIDRLLAAGAIRAGGGLSAVIPPRDLFGEWEG